MKVTSVRLLLLVVGLSGLIFVLTQVSSGESKASASGGESLLDHLRPERRPTSREVPPGTRLRLRLKEKITEGNRAGDTFVGKLDRSVEQGGKVLAPQGSPVIGRIMLLGEADEHSSSTEVSLVLEQVVVGKKAFPLKSLPLTLSMPVGSAPSVRRPLSLQGSGFLSQQEFREETAGTDKRATIYEPDTRLTFVLAERLRLPVFVRTD